MLILSSLPKSIIPSFLANQGRELNVHKMMCHTHTVIPTQLSYNRITVVYVLRGSQQNEKLSVL